MRNVGAGRREVVAPNLGGNERARECVQREVAECLRPSAKSGFDDKSETGVLEGCAGQRVVDAAQCHRRLVRRAT
jgi:hypothetical protein